MGIPCQLRQSLQVLFTTGQVWAEMSARQGKDDFDDDTVFLLLLQLRSLDEKTLSTMYEIQDNGGWVERAEVSIQT